MTIEASRSEAAPPQWRTFPSRGELARALAHDVADTLEAMIVRRAKAFLAVSGGSTPDLFLSALSEQDIDWTRVTVTLVDERFVPEGSDRSNARLLRERLLVNRAAAARFVPLYRRADEAGAAARMAAADLADLPWPLDAAILGMGTDGHTASFFADADNLEQLLDPSNAATVLPVEAPSACEPRLTLSLARLVEAPFLALHIEGAEKRAVLEQVIGGAEDLPVGAIFEAGRRPLPIYWTS